MSPKLTSFINDTRSFLHNFGVNSNLVKYMCAHTTMAKQTYFTLAQIFATGKSSQISPFLELQLQVRNVSNTVRGSHKGGHGRHINCKQHYRTCKIILQKGKS